MFNPFRKKKIAADSSEDLWEEYKGRGNTDEVILKKSGSIAQFIFEFSVETSKSFQEQIGDLTNLSDENSGKVFIEFVLYYLHFISRLTYFYNWGSNEQKLFCDALFIEVRDLLSRAQESGIEAESFREQFTELYNSRQIEYGEYSQVVPSDGEGKQNTLIWEFGKKVAALIGEEMNIIVIMPAQSAAFDFLKLPWENIFGKKEHS